MQRKTLQEQCERLRNLKRPAADLRRQCARFVLDYSQAIADACPDIPPDLNDRAADIWEPLLALADFAGDPWPMFARQAALGLTNNSQESNPAGSLFLDILVIFATKGADRLFTRTIVEGLNRFQSHAWAEARNGKPITDIWLSQQLRPYGIRPKSMRIEGVISRGYLIEDLKECFKRYIQPAEFDALTRELATLEPTPPESAATPAAEIP